MDKGLSFLCLQGAQIFEAVGLDPTVRIYFYVSIKFMFYYEYISATMCNAMQCNVILSVLM